MIIHTPKTRKAFLNADSMLAVEGTQQLTASNSNLNQADYSISFFIRRTGTSWSVAKGTFSIDQSDLSLELERLYHIVYTSGEYFINSLKAGTHSKVFDTAADLVLSGDLQITHLTFFNRDLTAVEISYMFRWVGVVPESAHGNCVAHYVADRKGLTLWDVVEQYNYSKVTDLTSQHGTLQNYTDSEAGIPDVQTVTAYKDFYTKQNLVWWKDDDADGVPDTDVDGFIIEKDSDLPELVNALYCGSESNQYIEMSALPDSNTGCVVIAFHPAQYGRQPIFQQAIHGGTSHAFEIIYDRFTDNKGYLSFALKSGSINAGWYPSLDGVTIPEFAINQTHVIVWQKRDSNSEWEIYINGVKFLYRVATYGNTASYLRWWNDLTSLNTGNLWLNADRYSTSDAQGDLNYLFFAVSQQTLTHKQIVDLTNNTLLKRPINKWSITWEWLINFNKIIDDTAVSGKYLIEDLSGQNHEIEAVNYTAANLDPQDPSYSFTLIDDLR